MLDLENEKDKIKNVKTAKNIAIGFRQEFQRIFEGVGYRNFGYRKKNGYRAGYRNSYIEQKKPKKRKRVNCSFTKQEYNQIVKHAKQVGLAPTAFLKQTVFAYLNQGIVIPKDINAHLNKITLELRKAGNNLNQIARKANTVKKATIFDLVSAKRILRDMEKKVENALPPSTSFLLRGGIKETGDYKVHEQKVGELRTIDSIYQ
jgi:hypothetical protein